MQVIQDIDISCSVEEGDRWIGSTEGIIYVYNEVARVKSKEGVLSRIVEACNFKEQFENYNFIIKEDSFRVRGYFERGEWQSIIRRIVETCHLEEKFPKDTDISEDGFVAKINEEKVQVLQIVPIYVDCYPDIPKVLWRMNMSDLKDLEGMTLEEKIKAVQDSAKRIEDELFNSDKPPLDDDYDDFGEYDFMPIGE